MKIRIKDIITFSKKAEGPKKTLLRNIKTPKIATGEGGDYWITSTSAIANAIKHENKELIQEKIEALHGKIKGTPHRLTKSQFNRNLEILENFKDFEFDSILPNERVEFISKPRDYEIISLRSLPIQIRPTHVFKFKENGVDKIGGIWLVTILNGFRRNELKLFVDALFRYLKAHYSEDYEISDEYCIAVDTSLKTKMNYEEINDANVSKELNSLLDEINTLI